MEPGGSDDGQTLAFGKMVEKVIEQKLLNILPQLVKSMVTTTVKQEVVPVAEGLFRRVVQEEIQKFEQKLLNGGIGSEERSLQMKFLDEVSGTVQTSKELQGIKGDCLKVALVDAATGQIVRCGPESSAKVEIVLLDDNGEDNVTHENFERRIIREGDKEKPHFTRSVYIFLDKGVGSLSGVKLGQNSGWTKNYNCRLGARIVQMFRGIVVQEAWTGPFEVQDNRNEHAKKHYPPTLSSEVWRLEKIARNGERRIRLEGKNIKTLRDFLFWLNVKPDDLKQILDLGDSRWNSAVKHARTCIIDDERMYSHESSTEPQIRVIYDAVGKLKGEIVESHFVPIDKLSPDRKVRARELLSSILEQSAFGERYDTSFSNEDSLLKEFPYRSSGTNASTNASLQHGGVAVSGPSDSLGSRETMELCNPVSGPFRDPQITSGVPREDLGTSGQSQRSSDIDAFSNPSIQQLSSGPDLAFWENILRDQPYLPSPSINSADIGLFDSIVYDAEPFGGDWAGLSPFIGSTGGPETVGGSSSSIRFNVALYSDGATAGGEDPLRHGFSEVNRNESDEVKMKLRVHVCMMKFVVRIVEDVDSPIRKKQRVAYA